MAQTITIGSPQFKVLLGQMEDAIGTLEYHMGLLGTAGGLVNKEFDHATLSWDSPAADGFKELLPAVTTNLGELLDALDNIHSRLVTTYQNYQDMEQANIRTLTPTGSGPQSASGQPGRLEALAVVPPPAPSVKAVPQKPDRLEALQVAPPPPAPTRVTAKPAPAQPAPAQPGRLERLEPAGTTPPQHNAHDAAKPQNHKVAPDHQKPHDHKGHHRDAKIRESPKPEEHQRVHRAEEAPRLARDQPLVPKDDDGQ
jgi:hypothetical protein